MDRVKAKKKYLEASWAILDREPGMDDLAEGDAGSVVLEKMGTDLKIYPYQDTNRNDRLFLGRFEFPTYKADFTFSEAVAEKSQGFVDFLCGFPIDCVEMMVAVGEYSSKAKEGQDSKVAVQAGTGVTAPVPSGDSKFFKWPESSKILLNLTAIATKNVGKIFAKNLTGEDKPAKVHWWFRVQLTGDTKTFPVPGEFLGLGVRMFPGMYWGHQKSSPFIYSGNWMDTVYYSGAIITEIVESTDTTPYRKYKVKWRNTTVTATPSDFAEYKVDDHVTILKDVAATKSSQLWKNADMKTFGTNWTIAPITFYGLEKEGD